MKSPLIQVQSFLSTLPEPMLEEITFEAARRFGVNLLEENGPGPNAPDGLNRTLHVRAIIDYIFLTCGNAEHHERYLQWHIAKNGLSEAPGITEENKSPV